MESVVDDFLPNGIWHFTGRDGISGILDAGAIRPSVRSGKPRDFYAAHLEAVAIFDFSYATSNNVDAEGFAIQRTNVFGFLNQFSELAVGITFDESLRSSLLGPAGIGDFRVPTFNEEGLSYQPRHFPYLERWHVGPIKVNRIALVHVWRLDKAGPRSATNWVYQGREKTLEEAIRKI